MKFYADTDRMIRFLWIFPGVVPSDHPLTEDVRAGFMRPGEMNVEMDGRSERQLVRGVEEDPATADIESTRVKNHTLMLHFGANQAGTAPFTDSGEKAPSDFEKTVPVEGFEQNGITAGKKAVFLFAGFTDHDDGNMAQGRIGLDLQATLRSRHAGNFLGEINKLRFFRVAVGDGLGGALCFEEGYGDVAKKLLLYGQKES